MSPGGMTHRLRYLPLVCVVALFTSGLSMTPCEVTVESRDFNCRLLWNCSGLPSNTTYTVQTFTQGQSRWKEVAGCVQVTSWSCDFSRSFKDLDLYHFIRLGHEATLGHVQWMEPEQFDLRSDTIFSPPTVSLTLKEGKLTAEVQFPCSPKWRCRSFVRRSGSTVAEMAQDCCPVSLLLKPRTTVTLYNVHRPTEFQICSVSALNKTVSCEFRGLEQGQEYCAVANFTSSPLSTSLCIDLPSEPAEWIPWLLVGVCVLLFAFAVLLYLLQQLATPDTNLPQTLVLYTRICLAMKHICYWRWKESLQEEVSIKLAVHRDDCVGDHLSILSLSSCGTQHCIPGAQADQHSLGAGYCNKAFPVDSDWTEWDSGDMGRDSLWADCWWSPVQSLYDHRVDLCPPHGMGQGGIPLCSVRLEPCEAEDLHELE